MKSNNSSPDLSVFHKRTSSNNDKSGQIAEKDYFLDSRKKIRSICKGLCVNTQRYDPKKTITAIEEYMSDDKNKDRILYSEFSSFIYGLDVNGQSKLSTNLEKLSSYFLIEDTSAHTRKMVHKIYDHCLLALQQKTLSEDKNSVLKSHYETNIKKAKENVKNEVKEDIKRVEKDYITILGIFSSIILAFVGGLTFSTSVLQNIDAVSIYRLVLIVDGLAFILFNTLYMLLTFLGRIHNEGKSETRFIGKSWIITMNILFAVVAIGTIACYLLSITQLPDFLTKYFCWTKK